MTREEFAARKLRINIIAGIGIFALLSSYTVGYVMPGNVPLMILLTAIFFCCIFIAGTMWYRLSKETSSK
jgi:hypothetical protein